EHARSLQDCGLPGTSPGVGRHLRVDVNTVAPIPRGSEERELAGERFVVGVDTIAGPRGDVVWAAYDAHRDIGDVVLGAAAIGPRGRVRGGGQWAKTALRGERSRGDADVEPEQLG